MMVCEYCNKLVCVDLFKCSISFLLPPPALVPLFELSTQPLIKCVQRNDALPMMHSGGVGRAELGEISSQLVLWQLKNADPYRWRKNGFKENHWVVAVSRTLNQAARDLYVHPGGLAWPNEVNRSEMFNRLEPGSIFANFTLQINVSHRSNWIGVQCGAVLRAAPVFFHKCRGVRPISGQAVTIGTCHHSVCCKLNIRYRTPVTGGPKIKCTAVYITRRFIDTEFTNELQASALVSVAEPIESLAKRKVGAGRVFKICSGCYRPVGVDRLKHLHFSGRQFSFHNEE